MSARPKTGKPDREVYGLQGKQAEIMRLYEAGVSRPEIMAAVGVGEWYVKNTIIAFDVSKDHQRVVHEKKMARGSERMIEALRAVSRPKSEAQHG